MTGFLERLFGEEKEKTKYHESSETSAVWKSIHRSAEGKHDLNISVDAGFEPAFKDEKEVLVPKTKLEMLDEYIKRESKNPVFNKSVMFPKGTDLVFLGKDANVVSIVFGIFFFLFFLGIIASIFFSGRSFSMFFPFIIIFFVIISAIRGQIKKTMKL